MSKKQSRRSVSMNRAVYESVKAAAGSRGVTMAELVETALRAHGIAAPAVERQSAEAVDAMRAARGYVRHSSDERPLLTALGFE